MSLRNTCVVASLFTRRHKIVRCAEILCIYAARTQVNQLTPALLAKALRGELVPQEAQDEPASLLLERVHTSQTKPTKQ